MFYCQGYHCLPLVTIYMSRAAVECEEKTRVSNLEHDQAMEKHLISMAREIKKLRAELADAEKRARAAAAAAVAATPSNLSRVVSLLLVTMLILLQY